MGLSDRHSSTVPLVLNPESGVISPQFHVVVDEWFTTIPATPNTAPDFTTETWQKMFGESRYQFAWDDDEAKDNEAVPHENIEQVLTREHRTETARNRIAPPTPLPIADPPTTPSIDVPTHASSPTFNDFDEVTMPDLEDLDVETPVRESIPPPAPVQYESPVQREQMQSVQVEEPVQLPSAPESTHLPSPMPTPHQP
jgi:hypothetical protein